jgi:hypothetical protein
MDSLQGRVARSDPMRSGPMRAASRIRGERGVLLADPHRPSLYFLYAKFFSLVAS